MSKMLVFRTYAGALYDSFYQTSEKACQAPVIDLGTESPLNLFIQCFKEKCDICVNPNDVAIFVKHQKHLLNHFKIAIVITLTLR